MASVGDNPIDAVKNTAAQTSGARDTMQRIRNDPESEVGIKRSELERRQAEASAPRKVMSATGKTMDVKSSARAQQIIQQGVDKYQRDKRRRDIAEKMALVKKARWIFVAAAFGLVSYVAYEFLWPQYQRVQQRNKKMQLRKQMAQARYEEHMVKQEQSIGGGSGANETFTKLP